MGAGNPEKELVVNLDRCARPSVVGDYSGRVRRLCPAEYPVGFFGTHVDTAVTHFGTKVFVPVGAMKCVACGRSANGRDK